MLRAQAWRTASAGGLSTWCLVSGFLQVYSCKSLRLGPASQFRPVSTNYVIGFSFPVVPKGQARIRTQISAAHTKAELDKAIEAFIRIGKEMKVIEG